MTKSQIIIEIEKARLHLLTAANEHAFCSQKIIHLSSELDQLLNQYADFEKAQLH